MRHITSKSPISDGLIQKSLNCARPAKELLRTLLRTLGCPVPGPLRAPQDFTTRANESTMSDPYKHRIMQCVTLV